MPRSPNPPTKLDEIMGKVDSFYSTEGTAYHTCTKCDTGDSINPKYRRQGKGGLPKCKQCIRREEDRDC